MTDPFANVGPDYLEQLLDAAVRAPAAAADPASGRVAARLLLTLSEQEEDDRVEPYMSWGPGRRTVYEVRCYDPAEQVVAQDRYPSAGEAIRATGVCAARGGHTARVVAIVDDGEERWMMAVRGSVAIYRMPDPAQRPESDLTASNVVGQLRQLLAGMTVQVDATAIEQVVREAMGGAGQARVANGSTPESLEALVQAVVSRLAGLIPSADDIAARVTRQMAAPPAPAQAGASRTGAGVARPRPSLPPPRAVPAGTDVEP